MTISFVARTVVEELVADSDPPYLQVAMADAAGSHYLMLHRGQPFDDPEDWGMYIEVDEQLLSGYDCVASCELTPERMVVRTTKPLSPSKPVDLIEVWFAEGLGPLPELVARLRAIFTGRDDRLQVHNFPAA
jgi:hypothetical protein